MLTPFRGIEGLEGKEPVGAVLTIGTRGGERNQPIDRDRFYIKSPDATSGGSKEERALFRPQHPAFGVFNAAAPDLRRSVRGVLVHAREEECFEWHRKAQKLPAPFKNHSKLPACTGDGRQAQRLKIIQGGEVQYEAMPCPNDLCQFAQQPNERTPPCCKPWARLLFQPVWQSDKLPTPLMKFTTQSWHSIAALVGFFEYIREQAKLCGVDHPQLFGLPFELTLGEKTSPEKGTKFPVIRITPTLMIQAFLVGQVQRGEQLAQGKRYIALLDAPEQHPDVVAQDHAEVNAGIPRE